MTIDEKLLKDHKLAEASITGILDLKLHHIRFVEHLSIFWNGMVTSANFERDGELQKYYQEKTKALLPNIQKLLDQIDIPKWDTIVSLGNIKDKEVFEKIRDIFPVLMSTLDKLNMETLTELYNKADNLVSNEGLQTVERILYDTDKTTSIIWKPIESSDYDQKKIEEMVKFFRIHLALMLFLVPFCTAIHSMMKRGNNPGVTSEEDVKAIQESLETGKKIHETLENVLKEGRHAYFPVVVEKLMRQLIDEGQQKGIWKEERIIRELHNRFYWDDFLLLRWDNMTDMGVKWNHWQHWSLDHEGIDSVTINVSKQMYMVVRMSNDCVGFCDEQLNKVGKMLDDNAESFRVNDEKEIDDNRMYPELSKKGSGSPWFTFGIGHLMADADNSNEQNLVVYSTNSAKFTRRIFATKYYKKVFLFPYSYHHATSREYFVSNT